VHIRQAGFEDVDELARLRAAWREQEAASEFLAAFREWFLREQHSRWWWIAEADHARVGMVNMKLFDRMPSPDRAASRWGYLANLFVLPTHRGGGVGQSLLEAAVHRATVDGLVRLVLSPSELSVPLYGRQGFRPAHQLLFLPLNGGV
jgi:GNAT superfamily N-acetyltransferase